MIRRGVLAFIAIMSLNAVAASSGSASSNKYDRDMDSLGSNREIMKRARAYRGDNEIIAVQKRQVDRNGRIELGVNYGMSAIGGDTYVSTSMLSGQADYHFNPRWSVGARYSTYFNSLNSRGQQAMDTYQAQVAAGKSATRPDLAWPKDSWLGVFNFYPMYGKLDILDHSVTQFDVFILAGAGQINMPTSSSTLLTAGGGVGVWWAQHFSTRLELRWQGYNDRVYGETRNQNEMIAAITLGIFL